MSVTHQLVVGHRNTRRGHLKTKTKTVSDTVSTEPFALLNMNKRQRWSWMQIVGSIILVPVRI